MNLTDYAILNKLKLTKPQANLIAKLDGMGVIVSDLPRMVHNQVNGFGDTLNPFSAAIWISFRLVSMPEVWATISSKLRCDQ